MTIQLLMAVAQVLATALIGLLAFLVFIYNKNKDLLEYLRSEIYERQLIASTLLSSQENLTTHEEIIYGTRSPDVAEVRKKVLLFMWINQIQSLYHAAEAGYVSKESGMERGMTMIPLPKMARANRAHLVSLFIRLLFYYGITVLRYY